MPELWDRERRTGDDLQKVRVQSEERGGAQVQGHDAHDEHAGSPASGHPGSSPGRAARSARARSVNSAPAAPRRRAAPAAQGHDAGRGSSFHRERPTRDARRTSNRAGPREPERDAPGARWSAGESARRNPGCQSGRRFRSRRWWARSLWWSSARRPERLRCNGSGSAARLCPPGRAASRRVTARVRPASRRSAAARLWSAARWACSRRSRSRVRPTPGRFSRWLRSASRWSASWLWSASRRRSSVWSATRASAGLRAASGRSAHAGAFPVQSRRLRCSRPGARSPARFWSSAGWRRACPV